ncbi:Pkinase-domain-containing protein [Pluteus cervinus]|uniref:Pkinase-domain-containing protein n=1 Tax=Pluteus cervinus TaxID=181527 RepID=A0ACD3B5N7_9AGAR|nr:Pkinase-domain-containing protein [Pluteus cervinus]
MSAQIHPPQPYQRTMPQQAPSSRRFPLSSANATPPPKHQEKEKRQPHSPPLPRQNSKTTPPSPPKVICDYTGKLQFNRIGFLGEGGFARVYEVQDPRGTRLACKVVTKTSLKTKKAKTKLYAEIKIHRSLEHPNIVRFQECFEDEDNVYMSLELCPSGSLMDMLRRRRRFTEPESRVFMVQLIGACHYMHTHQVIHRDLKLGNLFLDADMNVKVGDFGLAALIENPGERKKTICGTPNYIAPEVLFDTANGHSFEVDTWSIGVILYTLVIGRPPFQTKDVKAIYQRIRDNVYEFPADRAISSNAQHLIQQILTPDPQMRPTLHEIVDHPFFIHGTVPSAIPSYAHDRAPDFRHITRPMSESNLRRLRRSSLLDEDQVTTIAVPKAPAPSAPGSSLPASSAGMSAKSITSSIAQQEKEFQKAVQPGSPISVLLSSARQPLIVGPAAGPGGNGENLMRKLQAVRESPLRKVVAQRAMIADDENAPTPRIRDEHDEETRLRKKELESQKARIVAQMAPVREEEEGEPEAEEENMAPPPPPHHVKKERLRESVKPKEKENPLPPRQAIAAAPPVKLNGFDAAAQILTLAFDAKAMGKVFRDPRDDAHLPLPNEKVFIVSWVDYCNKYGMGYALTDGSVGVHFNDSTTCVLSPDKQHFDYITSRRQGTVYVRKSHGIDLYPEELKNKVYLLKHFERYIMDRLYGDYEYAFEDSGRTKGMEWVQKYLRMKHVIVFKMSHDVLQFNFYDHSKVVLSSHGLLVTHIDKNYKMTRWSLSELMAISLRPPQDFDADQLKFNQRLVDKLKYCKEVLVSIKTASANGVSAEEVGPGSDMPPSLGASTHRPSKASLR